MSWGPATVEPSERVLGGAADLDAMGVRQVNTQRMAWRIWLVVSAFCFVICTAALLFLEPDSDFSTMMKTLVVGTTASIGGIAVIAVVLKLILGRKM